MGVRTVRALPGFILGLLAAIPAAAQPSQGSAEAVVQRQLEAFNKGDINAFAACYTDDVELFDLPAATPRLTGRAALIAEYAPMLSRYHPHATLVTRLVNGGFVIDKEQVRAGTHANDGVAIYQVEKGRIRRVWFTP